MLWPGLQWPRNRSRRQLPGLRRLTGYERRCDGLGLEGESAIRCHT